MPPVPTHRRVSLPFEDWPEIDRRLWAEALRDDDPLEAVGPAARWSAATRQKRAYGYGRWLRFLQRHEQLDPTISPAERATRARVDAYAAELRTTRAGSSVWNPLEDLCAVLGVFQGPADLFWLRAALRRAKATSRPARPIQPRLVAARDLWRAGLAEMARLDVERRGCRRYRAGAFRDGLAVALLAACPLRRRSFAGLELGRHLVAAGDSFVLRLGPADLKNGATLDFPLPTELGPGLQHYLEEHRPVLAERGRPTARLWLNVNGMPLTDAGLSERITKVTVRHLGRPISMHLFRHAAATSLAIDGPHHVRLLAALLGHAQLATGERYYNMAGSLEAARSYQDRLRAMMRGPVRGRGGSRTPP
jgi:integrase